MKKKSAKFFSIKLLITVKIVCLKNIKNTINEKNPKGTNF